MNTVDVRLHSPEEQYSLEPCPCPKKNLQDSSDILRFGKSPKDDDTYRSHATVDVECPKFKALNFERPPSKKNLSIEPRNRNRCDCPSTADFTKATYSYNYTLGNTRTMGTNTKTNSNTNRNVNSCFQNSSNTARPCSSSAARPCSSSATRPCSSTNSRSNTTRWNQRKTPRTCTTDRKGCCCGRCGVYSE